MKILFSLIVLMSSLSLWAQGSDRGGQDGSGGNICFIKDFSYCGRGYCWNMTGYRLVEEIQYPYLSLIPSMVRYYPILLNKKASEVNPLVNLTDLTETKAGRRARKNLAHAFRFDWDLQNLMLNFFDLLKTTYAVDKRFVAAYDVGLEVKSLCVPSSIQAAIRTNLNGTIIVSSEAWYKLPIESQETLLVHETLRFAQLFTSWFKTVSNQELQRLTMFISLSKTTPFKRSPFYRAFLKEKSFYRAFDELQLQTLMRDACENYEEVCEAKFPHGSYSVEKVLKAYDAVKEKCIEEKDYAGAVRKIFAKAKVMARGPNNPDGVRYEQSELDKLRLNSRQYRQDIEQMIVEEFSLSPQQHQ